jgi:hypothetical protein
MMAVQEPFEEAILWHDGEAKNAKQKFMQSW